jgi:hypothetical protein
VMCVNLSKTLESGLPKSVIRSITNCGLVRILATMTLRGRNSQRPSDQFCFKLINRNAARINQPCLPYLRDPADRPSLFPGGSGNRARLRTSVRPAWVDQTDACKSPACMTPAWERCPCSKSPDNRAI